MHRLIAHPDFPASPSQAVEVEVDRMHETWSLIFSVADPGALTIPEAGSGERIDGLWRTTCFELFVMPVGGTAYFEFNLSPSTQWAAYSFDRYRDGMRDLALPPPRIERRLNGLQATLDLSGLPGGDWRVGLSAVLQEGERKSYWALAHGEGPPDFHHDACFALQVAAAD